jgi:2-keto-4-pentenoate hydratase
VVPHHVADLAARLITAWDGGEPVDPSHAGWASLDHDSALALGRHVLERLGAGSDAETWKLGATDAATQDRLSVPGPICAPVVPSRVETAAESATVELGRFRHPRLEPEIGLVATAHGWAAVPAVEVADCRVAGWQLPPGAVLADGCLQGAMIFGAEGHQGDEVAVFVRCDGVEVARGAGRISEARERLAVLPAEAAPLRVATGALTPLLDCRPGRWDFDFGGLGRLVIDVVER